MPYKDPEKARARSRKYYHNNKDKYKNPDGTWKKSKNQNKYSKDYYWRHREKVREQQRQARSHDVLIGKCPICNKDDVHLFYDHCHKTNEFRGYICRHCNLLLGHAYDNLETLLNAREYLKRFTEKW